MENTHKLAATILTLLTIAATKGIGLATRWMADSLGVKVGDVTTALRRLARSGDVECQGKGTKARWFATNVEQEGDTLGDSQASAYQVFEAGGFRMFGAYGNVKEYDTRDPLTGAEGFDSEGEIIGLRETRNQERDDAMAESADKRELAVQALICAVAKHGPVTNDRDAFALRRRAELAVEAGTHRLALAEMESLDIDARLDREHTESLVAQSEIARLEIADALAASPSWNRVDSRCEGLTGADGETPVDNIGEADPDDDGRMVSLGSVDMKGYAWIRQERFKACLRFVSRCYRFNAMEKLGKARDLWTAKYDTSVRDCTRALKRKGEKERGERKPDWHALYLTRMQMEILGCKPVSTPVGWAATLSDNIARAALVHFAGVPCPSTLVRKERSVKRDEISPAMKKVQAFLARV